MLRKNKIIVLNAIGLVLVGVLSVNFYKMINKNTPADLEYNMKLKVEDLNKNLAGKEISEGIFFSNAIVGTNSILINISGKEKIPEEISSLLVARICVAFLNGYDSDAQRYGIILKFRESNYSSKRDIYVNIDLCRKMGYRPVTG